VHFAALPLQHCISESMNSGSLNIGCEQLQLGVDCSNIDHANPQVIPSLVMFFAEKSLSSKHGVDPVSWHLTGPEPQQDDICETT